MKKIFLFAIRLSVCNLRCHYCYLTKRPTSYEGVIPEMQYSPEQIAYAMRLDRVGASYINLCADGETLLLPDLAEYVRLLAEEGHYLEIVSNMVLTKKLEPLLELGPDVLSHVEFKCSFHWLELKKRGLLDRFANNVNAAWEAGASCNVEITPSDELIPEIDELKAFSMERFGALPHVTIARDDSTKGIDRLTSLTHEEYIETWGSFGSPFFEFKDRIFGERRREFCYAGGWSYYVDMATGDATQCYNSTHVCNVFANPDEPLPELPIGRCPLAHCYNGHMLATSGLLPDLDLGYRYGDIRDRERTDGTHWLQPELKSFFNTRVCDNNEELTATAKVAAVARTDAARAVSGLARRAKGLVHRD